MSDGRKYGKFTDLFLEIQPEKTEPNEWQAQPYGYFKGEEDIPNSGYVWAFR